MRRLFGPLKLLPGMSALPPLDMQFVNEEYVQTMNSCSQQRKRWASPWILTCTEVLSFAGIFRWLVQCCTNQSWWSGLEAGSGTSKHNSPTILEQGVLAK